MIPLDFVAGTHGHFLEYVINRALAYTDLDFNPFTGLGTSHQRPKRYLEHRMIVCDHWFENDPAAVTRANQTIRITFEQKDLLLVSSLSLLRAADLNIDNDVLHEDTVIKLQNPYYSHVLQQIYQSYPFLDRGRNDIPRSVLREFFKFGFGNPDINGYWIKLQDMRQVPAGDVFEITLDCIYDLNRLIQMLGALSSWLDRSLTVDWLPAIHELFLSKIPYLHHRDQCESIIRAVIDQESIDIPNLSLLQESYINGRLEQHLRKEMPFHQQCYFTNTKDMLQYIKTQAPNI